MINSRILATVAILATVPAVPALAQTSVHEAGVDILRLDGALQPTDKTVASHSTNDVLLLAQSFQSSTAGKETATRPWAAPVGHRQPRVIDVPVLSSASQDFFEQEDVNVDRRISGICRGC
jgi:hypothetical protein